jgi:hypothetical protein
MVNRVGQLEIRLINSDLGPWCLVEMLTLEISAVSKLATTGPEISDELR